MWLDALTTVEAAPDPVLRAVVYGDNDDDQDDVDLDENPPEARNRDLSPPTSRTMPRIIPSTFPG
jgi:hypothetical protein